MKDLKEKTIRGGLARLAAQAANFVLRLGSLTVLARLLGPKEFGLVGMVTAFTGVLDLFRDFGLSAAAIQRKTVTDDQISTLFWVNLLVGALLGILAVAMAPAIAAFYNEPCLVAVTMVLGAGFLFNAAGVQHGAILQREMRFTALAVINTTSLVAGIAIAMLGAIAGYGYWALVAMTVTSPVIATTGFWIATRWVPKMPQKGTGIRSMMRFGGILTLNSLLAYLAYNLDKVLLGSQCPGDLRKGVPARQHSYSKSEFGSRRGGVFGSVPTPGRSLPPQKLLPQRLLSRPGDDSSCHRRVHAFWP
jgi:O-antigen/teichoic acid export membrane protein